jgi:hypothetical protein
MEWQLTARLCLRHPGPRWLEALPQEEHQAIPRQAAAPLGIEAALNLNTSIVIFWCLR